MTEDFPFSQACENNKRAIADVLEKHLAAKNSVLEIGGGTGQHAIFFGEKFSHLMWQSSDVSENLTNLNLRINHANLRNIPPAFSLDADDLKWQANSYDAIFTANSLHIMPFSSVDKLFAKVGNHLNSGGLLLIYGPFKYNGEFTTESNASFDLWLKDRNSQSGIRDFETVNELALRSGLTLLEDNSMPASNQLLVWTKP